MPLDHRLLPPFLPRLATLSLGVAVLLGACSAKTSTASEAEILQVTVTKPHCPLAEDGDGKVYFLRGDGLPKELAKGDRLKLTGHRVMTRFLPKDPSCRGFALVFQVEHAEKPEPGEPAGPAGARGVGHTQPVR